MSFRHIIALSRFCIFACIICWSESLMAQQKTIPLNRNFTQEVERTMLRDTAQVVHMASKPFLESAMDLTNVRMLGKDTLKVYSVDQGLLFKHHLLSIRKDDFFLAVDPLFDFSYGLDLADKTAYADTVNLFNNQRGLQFLGDIGTKFSFQTSFYENQSFLPLYLKNFADTSGVVPGFGRTKPYRNGGFDYAMANGWISYTPRKWVNIQFGNGKNFIGHGYRSLLLSDAAFSYPYIKATTNFFRNKLQYTAMYASLQTLERLPLGEVPEALFKRKGASINYLSWIPNSRIELGLFEGVIWERYDSTGTKPQPWGAYIPVIGVNTAINGLSSKQNVLVGANLKIKITKNFYVYGQVALDDSRHGAVGYQAGGKYFDLLINGLDLQVEWNSLGDNMYASAFPLQSYTHVNQPLGHPTGPATNELIGILNYRYRRFITQVKYNTFVHSTGPEGSWMNNPEVVQTNIAAWPVLSTSQLDVTAGIYINPKTNVQLLLGYTGRTDKINYNWMDDTTNHTSFVYIAFRTNLINRYADF